MTIAIVRKRLLVLSACGAGLLSFATSPAQAANATSFVASSGSDSNPCTRASPCATLQGAYAKTDPAGEIDCIDTANYGPLTIGRSITINCVHAHATTREIDINSTGAAFNVVLDGLDVNGQQDAGTMDPYGVQIQGTGGHVTVRHSKLQAEVAAMGIYYQGEISVDLEDVDIDDFDHTESFGLSNHGIQILGIGGSAAHIDVRNSRIVRGGPESYGIYVGGNSPVFLNIEGSEISHAETGLFSPGLGLLTLNVRNSRLLGATTDSVDLAGPTKATFDDSEVSGSGNGIVLDSESLGTSTVIRGTTISHNTGYGILASGSRARIVVTRSTIAENGTGVSAQAAGAIYSDGSNHLVLNAVNGTFTGTVSQQ